MFSDALILSSCPLILGLKYTRILLCTVNVEAQMDYSISKKWSLSIYGEQNLDARRYRGLSSEVIPTTLGSNIILKINKGWKLKTDVRYQYNTIRKKWEWVPQVSISYEW